MRFADVAVQRMLNALDESGGAGVGATHGSLHTAYSASGANEVTGGSPAYARKAATWAAASGRSKATSASMVFDVPASTTVRWVGFWDAVSAGNFLGMVPNGGGTPESAVVPDISNDVFEAPSHGFSNTNTVVVWTVPGVALPTGVSEGTVYYITNASTDDFTLSLTSGGSTINITAVGACFVQRIVEEAFGAQGTHTVSTATMSVD
jgi:hypothetical protein